MACLHERYGQWQEDDSDTTDSYQIHTVTVPRRSRRGYHKPSQWRRKMVDFINKAQSFTKYLIFKQPVGHGRSSPEKYDLRQIFRSYEAKSELFNEEDRENMAALDLMQRGAAVDQC